jgi:hypothetical protein
MTSREKMFECTLTSPDGEYRVYLRGWSGSEAELRFREILATEGIDARGPIRVRPSGTEPYRRRAPETVKGDVVATRHGHAAPRP